MLMIDKVYHAANVLKEVARKTDLIAAKGMNEAGNIWLKTENLQVTGSFKVRGAYYKLSQLTDEEKERGVIACSAGNHAQGVALAAQKKGIKATICIPDSAPISKVEATKSYGAEVVLVPGTYDDAYAYAVELQQQNGLTFIHPFDDEDVIAGQGTIGLEIIDQMPDVEAVVVPIGGGGLISGVAFTIKTLFPKCKVYGVQAAKAASMERSIKKGEPVTLRHSATFADGIAVKHPGDTTFAMVQQYVDEIVTVTEDEIASAILFLMEKQKLVAEGAGAVSVAAVMSGKLKLNSEKTVCLLSGGNIDVNILSRVITRGLVNSGRNATLTIALVDKPGQLEGISRIISENGGNVVSVQYDRSNPDMAINSCFIKLALETRDHQQIKDIEAGLAKAGFIIVKSPETNACCAI
ncbi:threonine ammonia-lyase [Scatolibacter rhodanostii]|uniref:threonine ammonia-lyase n=1 Tax=Scatolibacter rhodanostii TaxID=2014781 RepID=UPI000C071ABC|nr:threonine ammonia-lyase [Scatolibacter rhodanostii]